MFHANDNYQTWKITLFVAWTCITEYAVELANLRELPVVRLFVINSIEYIGFACSFWYILDMGYVYRGRF
ncbi:hypothetical protein F4777DRAFT_561511 [Nemania sp. FL0916]|nr:hypothetical protein F4777DRAFT_561511 [Nemania sp. FL0916]